jgi:hypothetical protein
MNYAVLVYLFVSIFIAISRIRARQRYEAYMDTVPIGDAYLHQPGRPLLDGLTTIFFPARLFIRAWMKIAKIFNTRI